jgi:tetratricopeptide (TPR) repeat protein
MRVIKILLFLILTIIFNCSYADNSVELKKQFKQLFLNGKMEPWKKLVDSLQNIPLTETENEVLLYSEYGLIGYLIGKGEKKQAKIELEKFKNHIADRLSLKPHDATLHAFKAASVGFSIWLQPWKAVYMGSENKSAVDNALLYHKAEPMPLFEWANSLYFRPAFVGGNKPKSVELFKRVLEIYKHSDHENWMYYNVYAWLGQVYARQGEKEVARQFYLEILKEAPGFNWVKNDLLPDLDREHKKFLFLELDF